MPGWGSAYRIKKQSFLNRFEKNWCLDPCFWVSTIHCWCPFCRLVVMVYAWQCQSSSKKYEKWQKRQLSLCYKFWHDKSVPLEIMNPGFFRFVLIYSSQNSNPFLFVYPLLLNTIVCVWNEMLNNHNCSQFGYSDILVNQIKLIFYHVQASFLPLWWYGLVLVQVPRRDGWHSMR